jgi:hypothetical protein
LTTGVSGATNFTIKGGQNIVARILVDENGNIVSQSMTATNTIESGNNQPATSDGVAAAIASKLNVQDAINIDLNTLTIIGFYKLQYSTTGIPLNYPKNSFGTLFVAHGRGEGIQQVFYADNGLEIYVRYYSSNTWSDWEKLISKADDFTITLNSSVTGLYQSLKIGNLRIITGRFSGLGDGPNKLLFTISGSDDRPSIDVGCAVVLEKTGLKSVGTLVLTAGGNATIWWDGSGMTSPNYAFFSITYKI